MRKFLLFFTGFFLLALFAWHCITKNPLHTESSGYTGSAGNYWIDWNLLFTPGSLKDRASIIKNLEDYLRNYVHDSNNVAVLEFHYNYCPCDSFLTNMNVTALWGSGQIVSAPPTKPKPGPSGDYALGNNFQMAVPDRVDTMPNHIDTNNIYVHNDTLIAGSLNATRKKLLAVIDTGLDTALFRRSYPNAVWAGNLLWQENAGIPTLFDVVPGEPAGKLFDNAPVRHGTAATEIALSQMNKLSASRIPQIMSVRAFDDSEKGSIYTVSCAISYAIKNHADYINASWGYFGPLDSILRYYVKKANDQNEPVRIIAAAGNLRGVHSRIPCNQVLNADGSLDNVSAADGLFYPACFSPDFPNLISVNQLDTLISPAAQQGSTILPCYYQNYSQNYITVGALETPDPADGCCTFKVLFLPSAIEGSSFATPVVTGWLMSDLWSQSTDVKSYINTNANHQTGVLYTNRGSYYKFNQAR